MSFFSWLAPSKTQDELPDIFPLPIKQFDFVWIDVRNIYSRILIDVLERTQGIPEDKQPGVFVRRINGKKISSPFP